VAKEMNREWNPQEPEYKIYPCNKKLESHVPSLVTTYCAVYHDKGCDPNNLCVFATKTIEKKVGSTLLHKLDFSKTKK
jgi:hypothetical protein